jgi:hypothetical protein
MKILEQILPGTTPEETTPVTPRKKPKPATPAPSRPTQPNTPARTGQKTPATQTEKKSYWKRNPGLNPYQIKKLQDLLFQEESDYNGPSKNNPSVTTEVGVENYGEWPNAIEKINRKTNKKEWKYPIVSRWFELRYKNNIEKLLLDLNQRDIKTIGQEVVSTNIKENTKKITKGDYGDGIDLLQTFLVRRGLLAYDYYQEGTVDLATYQAVARLMSGSRQIYVFEPGEEPTYKQIFEKLQKPTQQETPTQQRTTNQLVAGEKKSINPNQPSTGEKQSSGTEQSKKSEEKKAETPTVTTKYKHNIPMSETPIDRRSCSEALKRYDERGNEKKDSGSDYKNTKVANKEFTQYEIDKVHIYRCIKSNKKPFRGLTGQEPNKQISDMLTRVQSPYTMSDRFDVITLNENKTKPMKGVIKESLIKFKMKKQDLLIETNLVKNRLSVIQTSNISSDKNFEMFLAKVIAEMRIMETKGFSKTSLNEGLFDFISGSFGPSVTSGVVGTFSERFTKYFLGKLGLTMDSKFGNIVITAIGNSVERGEFLSLFSDCRKMADLIADSIVEGYFKKKLERSSFGNIVGGVLSDAVRNTVADALLQSDIANNLTSKITGPICNIMSSVQNKSNELETKLRNKIVS